MAEIELSGNRYSIGRLNAKQQFHLSRRIAPVLPPLIPVYLRLAQGGTPLMDDPSSLGELLQPFTDGLAAMKDEDADYIMGVCLSVVQRQQNGAWANVWSTSQGVCMFQDMDLGVILPLIVRVITQNLGPFMQGLLTSHGSGPAEAQ